MIMSTPAGYCILQLHEKVHSTMEEIVRKALTGEEKKMDYILGKPAKLAKFDCYKPVVKSFSEEYFSFSKVYVKTHTDPFNYTFKFCLLWLCQVDYTLHHVYTLSNLCEAGQ